LIEQSVFLFPPLALAYLGYTKLNKKHLWLISSMFGLTLAKYVLITLVQRKAFMDISLDEIIKRIGLYFKWSLPFPDVVPLYTSLLAVSIIGFGFILYFKRANRIPRINKNFAHLKPKLYIAYIYSFLLCWAVSTIIAFLIFSDSFRPRYTHISSFGLNAVVIFSLYIILDRKVLRRVKFLPFILIGLILFSGVFRFINLRQRFQIPNATRSLITRELNQVTFPLNSQIVLSGLTGSDIGNPLGWNRSSGYLKFILKRDDINGLIGGSNAGNFSPHFNPKRRSKSGYFKMSGLSPNKPLFLFIFDRGKGKLVQQKYALEWRGQSKYASWTIYKTNKRTGKISPFQRGNGLQEYMKTVQSLKKKGIYQHDIFWGWPLSKHDKKRLKSSKLDPEILMGDLINQFIKIHPIKANLVRRISKRVGNISGQAQWGENLQLLTTFADEGGLNITRKKIFLYFLFKSLGNFNINDYVMRIFINEKENNIHARSIRFGIKGEETTIQAGDFILGCALLPKKKLEKIETPETVYCRVSIVSKESKYPLKLKKGRTRDKSNHFLLIPIDRILQNIDEK
jgi:hypothetical protein